MRKILLLVAAAFVATSFGTAASWAAGNNWYVDPESGTDSSTCGGESLINAEPTLNAATTGPCQSLNQALANATAGDSIFIEKGGTFGPILLNGNIAINGPADQSAVIEWVPSTAAGCIGATSCTVDGTASTAPTYAIEMGSNTGATIKLKNVIISAGATASAGAVKVGNIFGVAFKNVAIRGGSATLTNGQMVTVTPSSLNSSSGPVQLYFANTDIGFSPNGGGLYIEPTVAVSMLFQNSEVHNANFGIKADASSLASGSNIQIAIDSTEFFSFNGSAVTAKSVTSGGGSHVLLARSSIVNTGGSAFNINGPGSFGVLFESAISSNQTGVAISNNGGVTGFGTSEIFGNTNNVTGGSIYEQPLQ
jgi:hypothetical protein